MLNKRISSKVLGIVMAIMLGFNALTLGFQQLRHNHVVRGIQQEKQLLVEENKKLLLGIEESETKIIDRAFDKIEEDKTSSLKLIIFESKASNYSQTLTEDKSFGAIEKTIRTAFKYSAALDMSGVDAVKSQDGKKIYVSFHESMLDVYSVDNGHFRIESSKSLFNSFKGTTRDKMSQEIITLAEKEIKQEVSMDFSQRKDDILNSMREKLALNYGVDKSDIVLEISGRQ